MKACCLSLKGIIIILTRQLPTGMLEGLCEGGVVRGRDGYGRRRGRYTTGDYCKATPSLAKTIATRARMYTMTTPTCAL